jgi:ribosomal protein S18 acetylase RimI-like enzyme
MRDTITVRKATSADRSAIGELWWEMMMYHRECDPVFFRMKPRAEAIEGWLKRLDDCMADERQLVVVADAGGTLAGFATGRPGEDPPVFASPPHGFVTNFAVSKGWRRRGIGRRLYEALAEHFRGVGVSELRLTVAVGNAASNAFWREMGFDPCLVTMRRAPDA